MHTIHLQIELDDTLYKEIKKRGIDLQSQFQEFLADLRDDGYPAIDTKKARTRVVKTLESYKNGTMHTVSHEEIWSNIDKDIEKKLANSL